MPTRHAIIIGNDRWGGGRFLPGVAIDLEAIQNFLLSLYGGAWMPTEMTVIMQPISRDHFFSSLRHAVENGVDYFFIYFGGHGSLNRYGSPEFVLPGGDRISLDEIKDELREKAVLMISDSCQGNPDYRQNPILNEDLRRHPVYDPDLMQRARILFNEVLENLPRLFVYASAVCPGQSAEEDANGGTYTQNLLNGCQFMVGSQTYGNGVYDIGIPHQLASLAVETYTGHRQRPVLYQADNALQPPFLIKP